MTQTYDHIFRENIEPVFEAFVREILDIKPLSSQRLELGQPKTSEREPDYLRKVTLYDTPHPIILHIEFQTEIDKKMHLRMLEYHALLRRRFELDVYQYVVLLSGTAEEMPSTIVGFGISFEYKLVLLNEISFDSLLNTSVPELLVTAILSDFDLRDVDGIVERILVALRRRVPERRELQKYLTQLELLSNIRKISETVTKQINDMALTYNLDTDARYIQGIEQGIEQGMDIGLSRGESRKQLEVAQKLLQSGQTPEFTAEITGMNIEDVRKLAENSQH
jgi:predicted transposase/invertase (TIGR01784 family)